MRAGFATNSAPCLPPAGRQPPKRLRSPVDGLPTPQIRTYAGFASRSFRGRSWPSESLLRGTKFPVPGSRECVAQVLVQARESGDMTRLAELESVQIP